MVLFTKNIEVKISSFILNILKTGKLSAIITQTIIFLEQVIKCIKEGASKILLGNILK